MNKTEKKAKQWLQKQGYNDLVFQQRISPDFVSPSGKGFEVKLVRRNSVFFSNTQWQQLQSHPDVTVLVFNDNDAPQAIIPFQELKKPPSYWKHYRLSLTNLSERHYQARGRALRSIRGAFGMSQKRFAKLLGVTDFTVSRWETGHHRMSPLAQNNLVQLARAQNLVNLEVARQGYKALLETIGKGKASKKERRQG